MTTVNTFNVKIFGENAPLYVVGGKKATGNLVLATDLEHAQSLINWSDGFGNIFYYDTNTNKWLFVTEELESFLKIITSSLRSGDNQGIQEWKNTLEFKQYGITRKPGTAQLYLWYTAVSGNAVLTDSAKWIYLGDLANLDSMQTTINNWLTNFNVANKLLQADSNGFIPASNLPIADQTAHNLGTSDIQVITPLKLAQGKWGADTLLQTITVTTPVPSVAFTSNLNNTYNQYAIEIINVSPVTTNIILNMRISLDGGVTYRQTAGDYSYLMQGFTAANVNLNSNSAGTTRIPLSADVNNGRLSNVSGYYYNTSITFNNPSVVKSHIFRASSYYSTTTNVAAYVDICGSFIGTLSTFNAIQFYCSTGNINSGIFKLYGIK